MTYLEIYACKRQRGRKGVGLGGTYLLCLQLNSHSFFRAAFFWTKAMCRMKTTQVEKRKDRKISRFTCASAKWRLQTCYKFQCGQFELELNCVFASTALASCTYSAYHMNMTHRRLSFSIKIEERAYVLSIVSEMKLFYSQIISETNMAFAHFFCLFFFVILSLLDV
jgi:hypothetical protein